MKLAFLLFSIAMAAIGAGVAAPDSATCASLGEPMPAIITAMPLAAAAVCFFILAFRLEPEQEAKLWGLIKATHLLERVLFAAASAFATISILRYSLDNRVMQYWLIPIIAGAITVLGFSVRISKEHLKSLLNCARANGIILRSFLSAVILISAWEIVHFYIGTKLQKVPIPQGSISEADWERLQAALPFKLVRMSNADGVSVCFLRDKGRAEEIQSNLFKLKNAQAAPEHAQPSSTNPATRYP